MALVKISIPDLLELKELYKVEWPLHVMTFNTIKNLVDRFEKHPEWKEKAVFWSLNNDWKRNGTFVLTNGPDIFMNTLEPEPHNELKNVLMLTHFHDTVRFTDIRSIFRDVVHEVAVKRQFKVTIDNIGTYFIEPKEMCINNKIVIPEGFHLKPLKEDHAVKVNSLWPHRNKTSEDFIRNLIKYNVSMGIFDGDNELVAWTLTYDNDLPGVTQVVEAYQGEKLGVIVGVAVQAKIARDLDTDVYFGVTHDNTKVHNMMVKRGLAVLDLGRWITITKVNHAESQLE